MMKTKIVMGMFASLALLFTACAALGLYPEMRFVDPNASSGCALWTRGFIDAPPITLYDRPGGEVLGTIPRVFDYAFYPVEMVYFDYDYQYKVWVYGDIIEPEGGLALPPVGRYVWITDWEIDDPTDYSCSVLPLPNGIEGMVCDIHLPGPYSIAARVGPGRDYPIRRYLTADESGGQVHIDGYVNVGGTLLYRIVYDGEHLWIRSRYLDNDRDLVDVCTIEVRVPPEVSPLPPVLDEAPIETAISSEDFPVYHCRHLGGNNFEWYSARVTYDASGIPIREEITGGPFTGTWVEHCPAGEQSSPPQEPNSGELNRPSDPPSGEPTQTPSPTPCDDGC
jgi:hypothetical protein